ncbi:methyl-accepting chemotaxis protein [Rhodospirillum centenum]|uniref:Chemotaxis transducer, putative n=1 Tax=Rhodospirillum centenum (strain ATCC 51521 / SW) TaxID=414684 RepID=B6IVX7_RHOCS|nr:methyl-accepting chemotaxis protein [Rhodospirillum centenum]ACJ00451.1 chemotaxis transducer, putative [Rhodospirillum centenum SW]
MRLDIKTMLLAVLATLGLLLVGTAAVGLKTLSDASGNLETLYQDKVVPQRNLKVISDAYAVFVVDASHKVRNGNFTWAEGRASVAKAVRDIRDEWATFTTGRRFSAAEQALLEEALPRFRSADAAIADLTRILQEQDRAALDGFVKDRLYQTIDPVTETIGRIIDLQVGDAGLIFETSRHSQSVAIRLAELLLAIGIVAAVGGALAVLLRVIRPIARLTATLDVLARDDYSVAVPHTDKTDEMGRMARAVEVLKRHGLEARRLRTAQAEERAQAERRRHAALESMAEKVETETRSAVDQVAARTHDMDAHAGAMATSAGLVTANSQNVAAAAEQSLHNAQTVASAAEELAASIREIGTQVSYASSVSRRAVEKGDHTRRTIDTLSETVARIGEVATLIAEIAAQTNLLALNATIEAARAGDAGKGFAVVAGEVKNLAAQTSRSTDEIGRQIAEIQAVTRTAVAAVQEIGHTIEEMDQIAGTIAAAVEEQGAATQEISRNIIQAADAAREVSTRIAAVSAEATATGEHADTVRATAADVAHAVSDLRTVLVSVVRTSMAAAEDGTRTAA